MAVGGYSELFGDYTEPFAVFGALCFVYVALKLMRILVAIFTHLQGCLLGPAVDLKKSGQWAVVTGCTDGIGKSYAEELAGKGMDIVLISRNPIKLASQAADLEQQFNVRTRCVTADFTKTDIYENIKCQLAGLDIGVLVNNVGMLHDDSPETFCNTDNFFQYNMDIVNCNVMSNIMMTSIVLPGMLGRKRGIIISIGSVAGLRPLAYSAAYSASKAFGHFLSQALQMEYGSERIMIQTLVPGYVDTRLSRKVAQAMGLSVGLLNPTPQVYVQNAISTLGRESVTAGYWTHKLTKVLLSISPSFLILKYGEMTKARKHLVSAKED